MNEMLPANTFSSVISLMVLWGLLYWALPSFFRDRYRSKVYWLRSDLFAHAAAGRIDFDHPAYGFVRKIMNGYLRYWGDVSFLQIFAIHGRARDGAADFEEHWGRVTADLPADEKAYLSQCLDRLTQLVMLRMVLGSSFISCLLLPPVFLAATIRCCFGMVKKSLAIWIGAANSLAYAGGSQADLEAA